MREQIPPGCGENRRRRTPLPREEKTKKIPQKNELPGNSFCIRSSCGEEKSSASTICVRVTAWRKMRRLRWPRSSSSLSEIDSVTLISSNPIRSTLPGPRYDHPHGSRIRRTPSGRSGREGITLRLESGSFRELEVGPSGPTSCARSA